MATYRLWPSTSGAATPSSYTGSFISGTNFTVTQGGIWFQGYWWWVCTSGQTTTPVKCALWSVSQTNAGGSGNYVVPGSVVTSGTLTAGQWNYIPLPAPIQLSPGYVAGMTGGSVDGGCYCAAIGVNGNFPSTTSYWGNTAPNGITDGPLFAFGPSGGSYAAPYTMPQGSYTTGGSDPSVNMPASASGTDNFWVDVQVSDTAPAGYAGSYRIWPNKFDANSSTTGDAAVAYNIATEVDVAQSCTLGYVHYFVPNAMVIAAGLATRADVWNISTGLAVASITAPAWTTESGGAVTLSSSGQWVKAAFPANTVLPAGKYRVGVYNANGTTGSWSAKDPTTAYWYTGVGQNGITWGPVTAPNFTNAQPVNVYQGSGTTGGQSCFAATGSGTFPNEGTGISPAQNYWVDLEVTPVPGGSGLLMATFP